ncbi:MAG: caspase family protein, partial [Spirochaetia bacterium]|nr:caspase family protein [Spirochaetia bacterium]
MKKICLALLVFLLPLSFAAAQEKSAPRKFALVIGNGAYRNLARLKNPVNDAGDMGAALRGLGFTVESV